MISFGGFCWPVLQQPATASLAGGQARGEVCQQRYPMGTGRGFDGDIEYPSSRAAELSLCPECGHRGACGHDGAGLLAGGTKRLRRILPLLGPGTDTCEVELKSVKVGNQDRASSHLSWRFLSGNYGCHFAATQSDSSEQKPFIMCIHGAVCGCR